RGMVDERGLNFGRRDVVPRDEHDVVDPAEQPEVALVVALRAVAREVFPLEARPVRVLVALRVAPDAAQHRRPGTPQCEIAAAGNTNVAPGVVADVGLDAGERKRRAAGLQRRRAWERADHDRTGFGLPPRVDDRAA